MERAESSPLYQTLLTTLYSKKFPPGSKLNERLLCNEFGVGRIPLREVLFALERQHLLNYTINKGFRIPPLSKEELRECYPIIWALESEALESSLVLLKSRLPQFKKINTSFGKARDAGTLLTLDHSFHEIIASAADNNTLTETLQTIKTRVKRYDFLFFLDKELTKQSHAQHTEIIAAIEEGDVGRAITALKENWKVGLAELLTRL